MVERKCAKISERGKLLNWRARRVFMKEVEVEQNLEEGWGFEHMEPGWRSSRKCAMQSSNNRGRFWDIHCRISLQTWGRSGDFRNTGIPVHYSPSRQFSWRPCICSVGEDHILGFGEWLRALGGVLEKASGGRTVTMAVAVATGWWIGEVTALQYGISVDSLLNIREN